MALNLDFSYKYRELFKTKARYIDLFGGRGRGGSFTATQYFLHLITEPEYFRGYFMREVAGDIRESLWRDFKDRIEEAELEDYFVINESQMSAQYVPTGNLVLSKGFKKSSGNRTAKLKSLAGATHVTIEEAEEIGKADFRQLDDTLRTNKADIQILRIFNPPHRNHWIWGDYNLTEVDSPKGYYHATPKSGTNLLSIHSTYYDNINNINASSRVAYEKYKEDDPEYYYTIIRGLISEGVRGRIFKNWKRIPEIPGVYAKFYGLDWGYSGDPLCLVECEIHNRTLYVKQKIYKTGLTNDDLHEEMVKIDIPRRSPIYCDPSEPKDRDDMNRKGWNFIKAESNTIISGIKFMRQYDVYVTEKSSDIWSEVENYAYALDQYKNPTTDPIEKFNHAMDAIRYSLDKVRTPRSSLRVMK